jgi:hypothetical protein
MFNGIKGSMLKEDIPIKRRLGFSRSINIINDCDKKVYVIITPTHIKSIATIGIDGIGSIQFNEHGEYKTQEILILPGDRKFFYLDTRNIYVTILLEKEEGCWKQLRKNRRVDSGSSDYRITPNAVNECVEINFLDYSKK